MASAPLRLLVVDDHPVVREGLKALMGTQDDLTVVGEAGNGREALAAFRRLKPDVVLLDLRLPDVRGQELITSLLREDGKAAILIISHLAQGAEIRACLAAGALGYLLKDSPREDLFKGIKSVARGKPYLSQCAASLVEESAAHGVFIPKHLTAFLKELLGEGANPQEKQVLELLAEGKSQPEISRALGMPAGEIRVHVQGLLEKLGVASRLSRV